MGGRRVSGSVWKGQRAAHSPGRACRHRGRPEKRARTVSRTWPRSLVDLGREENEKASSINCFHPLSITPTPHRSITKARRRKISGQEIYTAVSVNGLLLFLFLSLSPLYFYSNNKSVNYTSTESRWKQLFKGLRFMVALGVYKCWNRFSR